MTLSEEKKRQILTELAEGKLTHEDLAAKYGVSRVSIFNWKTALKKGQNLTDQRKKGAGHYRRYPELVKQKILQVIALHPEFTVPEIHGWLTTQARLNVGYFVIQKILEAAHLNKKEERLVFAKQSPKPSANLVGFQGKIFPEELKREILTGVGSGKLTAVQVEQLYGLSRVTLYNWKKQLEQFGTLKPQFKSGKNHWHSLSSELTLKVLDAVANHPGFSVALLHEYLTSQHVSISYFYVQKILERYNLNKVEDRHIYAQKFAPQVISEPTQTVDTISIPSLDQLSPNVLPGPPPPEAVFASLPSLPVPPGTRSSKKQFVLKLTIITSLSFITILALLQFTATLVSAGSPGELIGFLFAFTALFIGTVFFAYSIKYYLTVALVLLFSRRQEKGDLGNRGNLGEGSRSGLVADVSGVELDRLPFVSIHLPLFNEKRVVNRLLEAVTSINYENYEVVVCDDSSDETKNIVNEWCNHPRIKILHRDNRQGFKGGALKEALKIMDPRAEFVLVFDADFLPYPDSIVQFLKYFQVSCGGLDRQVYQKSPIAAVQGYQWHVLNKSENWITRGVRTEYSGSYVIERSGGEIYQGLKQIAGSVFGIRADVLKHFGWGTSITEDFELTLRLYKAGYKVVYSPYIQAPSECVSTLKRLIRQRMRWAEGHSHNIKKLFNSVIKSPYLAFSEKFELLYLSPYYLQSAFFILGTLAWFVSEVVFKVRLPFWTQVWGWSLVLTNLLSLPLMNTVGLFLEESEEKDYGGIPAFVLLSYIVAPFQAYAAVKGFLEKKEGPWFRTPKTGKITDIYKRGRFYRWIEGVFGKPSTALSTKNSTNQSFRFPLVYPELSRRTFRLPKPRWVGNTALTLFILFTSTVVAFSPLIPLAVSGVEAQEVTRVITSASQPPSQEPIEGQLVVDLGGSQAIFHSEPRIRINREGMEIEMTLLKTGGLKSSQPETAYRQGPLVVYPKIAQGVNLEYRIGTTGVSEGVYLDYYQPFEMIESRLRLTSLELLLDNSGTIFLAPKKGGEPVFSLASPFMYEKAHPEVRSDGIVYKVEKKGRDYIVKKTLTLEGKAWLADPSRQFPVVIDPSINISSVIASGASNADTLFGSSQRKIAYMPNCDDGANPDKPCWYAFHADANTIAYKKCFLSDVCDADADWSSNVNVDGGDAGDVAPDTWVKGDDIWIAWVDTDNTVDAVEFRSLTTTTDTLGTKCTSSDQGDTSISTNQGAYIAVGDNGDVVAGYAFNSGSAGDVRDIWEVATGGCTFTSIYTGSGLPGATISWHADALALGNKIHIIYDDGANNINHGIFDVSNSTWDTTDNVVDIGSTVSGSFSTVTDGASIWVLYMDSTTTTIFRKCASTCTTTWTTETSPWSSGLTTSDSPTLSYFSTSVELRACIADGATSTTQDIVCKDSPAGTVSWGDQFSIGFTSSNYANVSSTMSSPTTKAHDFAIVVRDATNGVYRFATVPEQLWLLFVLAALAQISAKRFKIVKN